MRPEDLRFQVLRHLEQKPDMTQRELAAALGISLGWGNYWKYRITFKFRHSGVGRNPSSSRNSRNKRAYLYKLTPRGLSEKAALALRFLRRKEQERQALLQEIEVLRAERHLSREGCKVFCPLVRLHRRRAERMAAVIEYVAMRYNSDRLHSTLDHLTPREMELAAAA